MALGSVDCGTRPNRTGRDDRLGNLPGGAEQRHREFSAIHLVLKNALTEKCRAGRKHRTACGPRHRPNLGFIAFAHEFTVHDLERCERCRAHRSARECHSQAQPVVFALVLNPQVQSNVLLAVGQLGADLNQHTEEHHASRYAVGGHRRRSRLACG